MFTKKDIIAMQTKGLKNGQGHLIKITEEMENVANYFADAYIKKHNAEHKTDNRNLRNRLITGILGEMAACEALGYGWKAVDITIGDVWDYTHSDLQHIGINAGVKTSKLGNFPLLYVDKDEVEIICIVGEKGYIWVAGVATPSIIKNGCDDAFVKDKNILLKNKHMGHHKSAFVDFENLAELEIIKKGLEKYTLDSGIKKEASSVFGSPGGNITGDAAEGYRF